MKKLPFALCALMALTLCASPADANVAAVYATGQGGVQNTGNTDPGIGFELGARLLILDCYVDYMSFGGGESVSRGILGLRGGLGTKNFRLVLRGGLGGIREQNGALTHPLSGPDRTGAVARAGVDLEGRINPLFWLGFGVDGESYVFPNNSQGFVTTGSDVFASLKLIFELGI
jgi:hypothetical protein